MEDTTGLGKSYLLSVNEGAVPGSITMNFYIAMNLMNFG